MKRYTTRPRRPDEGDTYFFVNNTDAKNIIKNGDCIQYESFTVTGGVRWKYFTMLDTIISSSKDIIITPIAPKEAINILSWYESENAVKNLDMDIHIIYIYMQSLVQD